MSKKSIAILWGLNIALYIANIILVCIKGPTLATCIFGWVLASILAGLIIYLQFRLIDKNLEMHYLCEVIDTLMEEAQNQATAGEIDKVDKE